MTELSERTDPIGKYVTSLNGDFYMIREVAQLLGVHPNTIRELDKRKELVARGLGHEFEAYLGRVTVYLYTPETIERLRVYFAERQQVYDRPELLIERAPTGRKAKYTKEERKDRQKLFSKASYYARRAKEENDRGNFKGAREYLDKQRKIKKQLQMWGRE